MVKSWRDKYYLKQQLKSNIEIQPKIKIDKNKWNTKNKGFQVIQRSQKREQRKNEKDREIIKMVGLNPTVAIIALNLNGLQIQQLKNRNWIGEE